MSAAISAGAPSEPDGAFSDVDFRMIVDLIHREAGIVVREHKQAMVKGRLHRRARELGLSSIAAYCAVLRGPKAAAELPGLMNALTTNHTAFYREQHHFEHLEKVLAAEFTGVPRLRLWCAAASSGEEPYTIAATLAAAFGGRPRGDCLMLATDLDSNVLAVAEDGRYPASAFEKLTAQQRDRLALRPAGEDRMAMPDAWKALIRFRQLNILHDWPFRGPFQIIFCRNMLIYFDQPTKVDVVRRLVSVLAPGGYLYLGHSEALPGAVAGLSAVGRTIYRRS
jgi:chemotaxis protein methyltransferase CheR